MAYFSTYNSCLEGASVKRIALTFVCFVVFPDELVPPESHVPPGQQDARTHLLQVHVQLYPETDVSPQVQCGDALLQSVHFQPWGHSKYRVSPPTHHPMSSCILIVRLQHWGHCKQKYIHQDHPMPLHWQKGKCILTALPTAILVWIGSLCQNCRPK